MNTDYFKKEDIEWSNTWYEKANDYNTKRILIIGDSIARRFRGTLQKCLSEIAVDFFGSSSIYSNVLFYKQLDSFWEYKYDVIIVNLSRHAMHLETAKSEECEAIYKESVIKLLEYLEKKCKKIIVVSTTPSAKSDNLAQLDETFNVEIKKRNEIALNVAKSKGVAFFDYYNYALNLPEIFKHVDFVHFDRVADVYSAKKIIDELKKLNINGFDEILNQGLIKCEEIIKKQAKKKFCNKLISVKTTESHVFITLFSILKLKFRII